MAKYIETFLHGQMKNWDRSDGLFTCLKSSRWSHELMVRGYMWGLGRNGEILEHRNTVEKQWGKTILIK